MFRRITSTLRPHKSTFITASLLRRKEKNISTSTEWKEIKLNLINEQNVESEH